MEKLTCMLTHERFVRVRQGGEMRKRSGGVGEDIPGRDCDLSLCHCRVNTIDLNMT